MTPRKEFAQKAAKITKVLGGSERRVAINSLVRARLGLLDRIFKITQKLIVFKL
jgi:hypothetical protein